MLRTDAPAPTETLRISPLSEPLEADVEAALSKNLSACSSVAFAYVVEAQVPQRQPEASRALFAWLLPGALRSMRSALSVVSGAVAASLPEDQYLDVVILNSAPELLVDIEQAGLLLVVNDPDEHATALAAARAPADEPSPEPTAPPRAWWKLW